MTRNNFPIQTATFRERFFEIAVYALGEHVRFKIRAPVAEYAHGARSVFPLTALNDAGCKDGGGIAGGAFHNGIEELKHTVVIFAGSAFGGKGAE